MLTSEDWDKNVCLNYRIRDQLSVVVLCEFPKTRSFGRRDQYI